MVIEYYPTLFKSGHEDDRFIEFELLKRFAVGRKMPTDSADKGLITDTLKYEIITEKDRDSVMSMLKENFYNDEPLNIYLKLGDCDELTQYCLKTLKAGCSFKAVTPDNKIVGVILNDFMQRPDPDAVKESLAEGCANPKFRKILGLMDLVDSKYDFFEKYPHVDRGMEIKILSVDPEYRGRGIAHGLTRISMDYLRENHIPVMFVLCTSHFSARVMMKLNFECEFVLPFTEYLKDGVQVLKPDPPHLQAEIMIKWTSDPPSSNK